MLKVLKASKKFYIALALIALFSVSGIAVAAATLTPLSTNTVTQVNYPTVTTTVTGSPTATIQPFETLTTTTVSGTQAYTVTSTVAGSTSTESSDDYIPFAMYYTATSNNPFYEQLSPITVTTPDTSTLTEAYSSGYPGPLTMTIDAATSTYYDLGFYYVYQNLNSGQLGTFDPGSHTITATGTATFAVNLWLNPQDWNWAPEGVGQDTYQNLGTDGAYGLGQGTLAMGGNSGTVAISSASSFYITAAGASSCLHSDVGTTMTVSAIATTCGAGTPFALWYGIVTTAPSTVTTTINSIVSTPYP